MRPTSELMRLAPSPRAAGHRQRGAILPISLVMLLLLTIIGVTAMRTTTTQERMAANFRDRGIAFQAAETALRATEDWIQSQATDPTLTELGGISGYSDIAGGSFPGPRQAKSITVQEMQSRFDSYGESNSASPAEVYYRIEVEARGGSDTAQVTLVSTFARSN